MYNYQHVYDAKSFKSINYEEVMIVLNRSIIDMQLIMYRSYTQYNVRGHGSVTKLLCKKDEASVWLFYLFYRI